MRSRAGALVAAAALVLVAGTVAGLLALWPRAEPVGRVDPSLAGRAELAEAVAVEKVPCRNPAARECRRVAIRLLGGPERGRRASLTLGEAAFDPEVEVGDRLRVAPAAGPAVPGAEPYLFVDFERRSEMAALLIAFAALVVLVGRGRGMMSLVGLGLSLAVVVAFIVPAILAGRPPLAVAVAGSFAIMLATIALAHGVGPKSIAAALGTAASLLLTVTLAVAFTALADLSGFSSEEATLLGASVGDVSLEGLVLAGMVIAALGVLDDVTVTQASTVLALRQANPAHGSRQLYRRAISVGRDHVSATVNTLVLAYVGASLPVLLVFSVGGVPLADAVNREAVAEEVIATLVGSIGLIAAVPITTALAALLAVRLPVEALGEGGGGAHLH